MIILPWLRGVLGAHRAPVTWVLFIMNLGFALITFPGDYEGSKQLKKIVTPEFLRSNGRIYADYLEKNKEEGTHLNRMIAGRVLSVEQEPEFLGSLALQDRGFLSQARVLAPAGDQVAFTEWQEKVNSFHDIWSSLPSIFWGLSTDSKGGVQWISHAFTHGGYLHLLGNMYFLLIFGSLVEIWLGSAVFFLGYLGCGLFSAIAYILVQAEPGIPIVGASGAISGIMGLFCARYFKTRVKFFYMLLPIPIKTFMGTFTAPAGIALLLWILQDVTGMMASPVGAGGVAHAAHLGGFLAGLTMGALMVKIQPVDAHL
ncbi:MAG: rhomboid family intramembrane serine protease [Oligoflexia bacterium]|nr:rhomboid family intramembrane serine protease [Oligoflexia bacterium]